MTSKPNSDIREAIGSRDLDYILNAFFQGRPPQLKDSYKFESELWDFKASCPGHGETHKHAWAQIAADVLGFHNNSGGILIFGIADTTLTYCGTNAQIDSKLFSDKIRRYCGDKFSVSYCRAFQETSGRHLGIAIVPKRGLNVVPFFADAPVKDGDFYFKAGDVAIRRNDETTILRGEKASAFLSALKIPTSSAQFIVDEPGYKIIRPGWDNFIYRPALCDTIRHALTDDRTYITSLTGIGGVGKTALACWGALQVYEDKLFDYIISTSAKDRELTSSGISEMAPLASTLEDLLDQTLETIGFSEMKVAPIKEKRSFVTETLRGTRLLFFVDNLETVTDADLIDFLDNLPVPVKALLTSRRDKVRRAAFPIEVKAFEKNEALAFLEAAAARRGRDFILALKSSEKDLIIEACYRIPLVTEWFVGSVKNEVGAIELARELEQNPKRSDEVLEFSFRRIHTELSNEAKRILKALSMFSSPERIEALGAACQLSLDKVDSALEELSDASLLIRNFDRRLNDTTYSLLPITNRFAYAEVRKDPKVEADIRRAMRDWYEGRDIVDPMRRRTVLAIRLGQNNADSLLVDAAIQLRHEGKLSEAEDFFIQATQRNPNSWRAQRELGDFYKQERKTTLAIVCYKKAVSLAPKKGKDRALIFREYGILLRDGLDSDSLEKATTSLEIALIETPNDPVCIFVLGQVLCRRGMHRRAEPFLEKILTQPDPQKRSPAYSLLKQCYEHSQELVKLSELRSQARKDGINL